jgi:hypothetical protein
MTKNRPVDDLAFLAIRGWNEPLLGSGVIVLSMGDPSGKLTDEWFPATPSRIPDLAIPLVRESANGSSVSAFHPHCQKRKSYSK